MSERHLPPIFILGSERSGSTWLANIFDAHPGVEFYMEPFADYAGIFPEVPGRNIYIDEVDHGMKQKVRAGYNQLHQLKYPMSYKRNRALCFKRLDRYLFNTIFFLSRFRHRKMPLNIFR